MVQTMNIGYTKKSEKGREKDKMKYQYPKDKHTKICKKIDEPDTNCNSCIRNIREDTFKQKVLDELGYDYVHYKCSSSNLGGYYNCEHISNFKYELLHDEIIKLKNDMCKMLGNSINEQTFRMNWRELQYRNKLTKLLGVSPISSWDVIYKMVKRKLSSTNS